MEAKKGRGEIYDLNPSVVEQFFLALSIFITEEGA